MSKLIVSPIAIDLGAKNTGVYFAHYPAGSSPDEIDGEGKVYQLEKDKYTLLMANRTARRHQRRGYDRRQMAKRLFKLIWCEHFGLEWNKDVQQAVSFLLNRRGFSFLAEEYDADVLREFPKAALDLLPEEARPNESGDCDFASVLTEWANEGEAKVKAMYESFNKEPKRVRARLLFISRTDKLREYCSHRKEGKKISREKRPNLSRLSKWVLEDWVKGGVQGLPAIPSENAIDLVEYLNTQGTATSEKILHSLPDENDLKQQKNELNKSNWNFKSETFEMDKADFGESENPDIRTHLHHFVFALHKVYSELESGGRHRSKYFGEVKNVLERENHTHGYLKRFCGELQSGGFEGLTAKSLTNLIGHISNLELKPLRKYFNDKGHKKGDFLDESRLSEKFENWILREWRVNPQKDKLKADGADYSYKELRNQWENKSGTIIDFWLSTNPGWTIPPYQDNNNRRPPRCQSLLLNVDFLIRRYADWQKWLSELKKLKLLEDYLGDYAKDLEGLESGKGKKYFTKEQTGDLRTDSGRRSMAELDARVLQFIFDRVKAEDCLNLNEIYSHAKKLKQQLRDGEDTNVTSRKLLGAMNDSKLPAALKSDINDGNKGEPIFENSTFLHLVCKYYKLRQRARDGRIFIHPEYHFIKGRGYENTDRFDDKNHLLTYCNHKPRQKRYQILGDLAGRLQVSPRELEEFAEQYPGKSTDDRLFEWLRGVEGLQTNCKRAAKEQKDRRGRLKLDIQNVFGLIYHKKQAESPSPGEVKKILQSSKVNDAQRLHGFCERAKKLCFALAESLYDGSKQQEWQNELNKNPAAAVYLLAQINNIAFKERGGNATTCAVCGMDNAHRMQMVSTANGKDTIAKAQRLPAIPTRVIDGAVMRMARIVGGAIAKDKWQKIEPALEAGNEVCVPIITESNQFEFEPSKEELVRSQRTKPRKGKVLERGGESGIATAKDERIEAAGKGICPYTGEPVSEGDKDHIIPRSSYWGTLNDEANLIWASSRGNRDVKKENIFSLADLSSEYKNAVFEGKDDAQIEKWIINQIGDGSGEGFEFGKYRSFINLAPEQQTAFRHALFLVGHPLREKVINAIDNKNRALVNGTQRYFAEVLANELYKLAKNKGKEKLLSFDYFGVEAKPNSAGDSIYDLRKMYEKYDERIAEYAKSKDTKQQAYSHLIDAQLAFVIVADAHRGEGGLKLQISDNVTKEPYSKETGEVYDGGMLNRVQVTEDKFELKSLVRKKPTEDRYQHKTLFDSEPRAWHFLKLIEIQEAGQPSKYLKGFLDLSALQCCLGGDEWEKEIKNNYCHQDAESGNKYQYAHLLGEEEAQSLIGIYRIGGNRYEFGYENQNKKSLYPKTINEGKVNGRHFTVKLHQIDKSKVAKFLLRHFNTQTNPSDWNDNDCRIFKKLSHLWYFTKRRKILNQGQISVPSNFMKDMKMASCYDPSLIKAWNELAIEWQAHKDGDSEGDERSFLKGFFLKNRNGFPHERVRKDFSLPVLSRGQGYMLIRRGSWNGSPIYQCQSEKSGDQGVGLYRKYKNHAGEILDLLTPYFRRKSIVLLKNLNMLKKILLSEEGMDEIDDKCWYPVSVPENLMESIQCIENQYQSKGDSNYKVTFKEDVTIEGLIDLMLGGFHIDEMKVGQNKEDKDRIKSETNGYFKSNSEYLSVEQSKRKLEKELDAIKNEDMTEKQKIKKKYIGKWLECLGSIQKDGKTLLYKRGVGLRIERS